MVLAVLTTESYFRSWLFRICEIVYWLFLSIFSSTRAQSVSV
ncbi:hypothetical protein LCGC14_1329630, partial [marine sediment metagenome]